MMCAGGIQVEKKPQWGIHSENKGCLRRSRSVCVTSVLRPAVVPRTQSEMGKL